MFRQEGGLTPISPCLGKTCDNHKIPPGSAGLGLGERLNTTQTDLVTVAPFRAWPGWRGARPRQPLRGVFRGLGRVLQVGDFVGMICFMRPPNPTGNIWSDHEIDLVVADYFDMLQMELSKQPFVKARRYAALHQIIGRSKKSIEFKHQNISAVLHKLCIPWIRGLKPMANYQKALVAGVERHIEAMNAQGFMHEIKVQEMEEAGDLFFGSPPVLAASQEETPEYMERLIRKFDPAVRDAQNKALGDQGEERVFHFERVRLQRAGCEGLARRVRWVSQEDGDGAGYDILSFYPDGHERLLEVKTTNGHRKTPFYISENERAVSVERPDDYRIVRLHDFATDVGAFELRPPLEDVVNLQAVSYRAQFS